MQDLILFPLRVCFFLLLISTHILLREFRGLRGLFSYTQTLLEQSIDVPSLCLRQKDVTLTVNSHPSIPLARIRLPGCAAGRALVCGGLLRLVWRNGAEWLGTLVRRTASVY